MQGKKILLVEDDPKSLYAFKSVLQARGFEVVACDSAEAALALPHAAFHSAVLDVRLPKVQGPELAHSLLESHPQIQIIFVTAYNGVDGLCKKVPSCTVLLKPVEIDELIRHLTNTPSTPAFSANLCPPQS